MIFNSNINYESDSDIFSKVIYSFDIKLNLCEMCKFEMKNKYL